MSKMRSASGQRKRILGSYTLPLGQSVVGELRIRGPKTLLTVHSEEFLQPIHDGSTVQGISFRGEYVTLIDCRSPGAGHKSVPGEPTRYHADIFPHFVAVGNQHFQPKEAFVSGIHFTASDLPSLVYDFDAFGHVIDSRKIIDTVLTEAREIRDVEAGECPHVFYWTGKGRVFEVETVIGKVSVNHRPTFSMGGPSGAYIKNRMVVSVEPASPVTFDQAIDLLYVMNCFLTIAAGRTQELQHIQITTPITGSKPPQMWDVTPSYMWSSAEEDTLHEPRPRDVPLDPIKERAEFERVLTDWLKRHERWRMARVRYVECLRNSNHYGADRLVAAANMFDILPSEAVPASSEIAEDIAATRTACIELLRKLPVSIDRDGALSALGRMGKPSLPKKVLHRTSIVEERFGTMFNDLKIVVGVAVKCRNFYVHGSSGDVSFSKVEHLIPFLTDALEFVFAASDLIEAGWDAARWNAEPKGWGHNFARFVANYEFGLAELKKALSDGTILSS